MELAKHSSRTFCATLFAVALFAANGAFAQGPHERTIYNFQGDNGTAPDGKNPQGGLIADANGNLYGTTNGGGTSTTCPCGTVFQLSPPATAGGAWTETLLHSFSGGASDGGNPQGTLLMDRSGNLYGTTSTGGPSNFGTVFELSPPATVGGAWTETVLYIFPAGGKRGIGPGSTLAMDVNGNLYGTTGNGGTGERCIDKPIGCGTVFELHAPATVGGTWTQSLVFLFGQSEGDLYRPAHLVLHGSTFYGTASNGQGGVVFQLTRDHGDWTRTVLHDFSGGDIQSPDVVTFDSAGNIYGNANFGGGSCIGGCGGVFELSPPATPGDPWTETTLYTFTGGKDGYNPIGQLVFDKAGNLYGTARVGGLKNLSTHDNGTMFELSPPAISGGAWTETTLHEFGGIRINDENQPFQDGSQPFGGVVFVKGKFYGTTNGGGSLSFGTAFSVTIAP